MKAENRGMNVENRPGAAAETHVHASLQTTPAVPAHRRWAVNITPAERAARVVLGVAAIVVAAVLLTSAASGLAVGLEVLLAAAGLDLAVTGALGHCPLYQKLGFAPNSLRRSS